MSSDGGRTALRPRLDTVTVTAEADTAMVEVRLRLGDQTAVGSAAGAPTPLGTARAAALAVLAALGSCVDGVRFGLDTLVEGGTPGAPWATVVVSVVTRSGVDRLVGSALVEDGLPGAAVRAALQACNRRIGLLLEDAGGDVSARGSRAAHTDGDARRTELGGIVAHQLRGPATTLVGYLELLQAHVDSLDATARRSMIDHSLDGGHRLLGRLENLLAMARSPHLVPVARPQRVAVHHALRRALAEVPGADHDVEVCCPDDLYVQADPDHLAQVVGNYVDNALRHGAPPVVVEAVRDADWVAVRVTDAGAGVDDDQLATLFDPPGRGRVPTPGGTGLGLYVARLLAEANDGVVEARRGPEGGLCATVRVPAG